MTFTTSGLWPYIYLLVGGFVATQPWRYLGVMLSKNVDLDSELLRWVRAVSAALIAGLVSRMILFPPGALAGTPIWLRIASFGFGIAVFFLARRNTGAGIVAGVACLIAIQALLGR